MKKHGMTGSLTHALNALHGYIYGRWTPQYIHLLLNYIFPRLGPRGKKWWADRFHCKVIPPEEAKAIVAINKDIPLCDLEQIVPYPMARDFVLKGPPDIVVYELFMPSHTGTSMPPYSGMYDYRSAVR